MEFLTVTFQVICDKILDYTIGAVGRQLSYQVNYMSNVENLRTHVKKLEDARDKVLHKVEAARRNVEEIEGNVQSWLTCVEEIIVEAQEFFQYEGQANMKCCNGWCTNLKTHYQLSKRAYKMGLDVKKITNEGAFDTISHRMPIQGIETTISNKGYEAFDSRRSILEGVVEALKDENFSRIGVYGMGGVGKTMLVKEVGKQSLEDKLFDEVVMVVVSRTPDLKKIQRYIAEKLGLTLNEENESLRAYWLHERLKKEKKILMIIDDIWGKLDLEALGISFSDDQKGSKLLLASRSLEVLRNDMETQKNFYVRHLSDGEAGDLFEKIVGNIGKSPNLQSIATEIVKECAGLPIAITIVAHALKTRENSFVWRDALKQLKSSSPTNISEMHEKVYSSIEWSYKVLNDEEAKSLFLLCSLHSEDENILIAYLAIYAAGLGLFQGVFTMEEARDRVLTLVEKLKACCLLLDGDDNVTIKMHDVIRDVAINIAAKDKHMFAVRSIVDLKECSKRKESTAISLPYIDVCELPERLECPELKLFLLFEVHKCLKIPNLFFEEVKELRALDLTEMIILPQLPSSLSCLYNLQTLCLYHCELQDITIIGELKNLKFLTLVASNIKELPKEIGQLTNLQLLNLSYCEYLKVIPPNILSNLKWLEELYMEDSFNQWEVERQCSEGINAMVSELDHLSHLTTLCIHIPNAKILPKAECFEKLERYIILVGHNWDWKSEFEISRTLKLKLNGSFQSHDVIKTLLKSCEDLFVDDVKGVKNILYEFDFDGFQQLKHLHIQNNAEIQYITNSIGVRPVAFPVLESIDLYHMSNLQKICYGQLAMGSFHNLRILKLRTCHNLRFVFSSSMVGYFRQLQEIDICGCEVMGAIISKEREDNAEITDYVTTDKIEFPQLCSLDLRYLPKLMGLCSDTDFHLLFNDKVAFSILEKLYIKRIDNLKMIWHDQLVPDSFYKLQKLCVHKCENLMNIFPPNMLRRFKNLEELEIFKCNSMEVVFKITEINVIQTSDMIASQLRRLKLYNLSKLQHVWSSDPQAILTFQHLREIEVHHCEILKSLFPASVAKSLVQLERLHLQCCGVEEIVFLEEGSKTTNKFVFPRITILILVDLPNLKCFYSGKHTSEWPSLKKLEIYKCDKVMKIFGFDDLSFQHTNGLGHHHAPLFLIEKDTFPNLEELKLKWDDTMNQTFGRLLAEFFCKLKILELYCKGDRSTVFPSIIFQEQHVGILESLRMLKLSNIHMLMHMWKEKSKAGRAFQNLEFLEVSKCGRLKTLVPSSISFQNLNTLKVSKCHGIICLITSSTAKSLVHLKKVVIIECKRMTGIVTNEGGDEASNEIVFNQLEYLVLHGLCSLKNFHFGNCTIKFPLLKVVIVTGCPELKIFSNGFLSTPKLKGVKLAEKYEKGGWSGKAIIPGQQSWEGDLNSTIQQFWEDNFDTWMRQLFTEEMSGSNDRRRPTCTERGKAPALASQSDPFSGHQFVMNTEAQSEEIASILHYEEDSISVSNLDSPAYSTGDEMDTQGDEATDDANIGEGVISTVRPWVRRKKEKAN